MVLVSPLPEAPPSLSNQAESSSQPEFVPPDAENIEMPLPSNPQTFFLGGIFTLGMLAALYIASSIILPVVLAFVLKLLLQPGVRFLERLGVPRIVGALVAILLVLGTLGGLVAALSVPAATWAQRLPEGIPRLEAHLVVLRAPIQALQTIIGQAEQAADAPGQKGSVISLHRDLGITGALVSGTRAILDGLFTTILVLFFLLVSADLLVSLSQGKPIAACERLQSRSSGRRCPEPTISTRPTP